MVNFFIFLGEWTHMNKKLSAFLGIVLFLSALSISEGQKIEKNVKIILTKNLNQIYYPLTNEPDEKVTKDFENEIKSITNDKTDVVLCDGGNFAGPAIDSETTYIPRAFQSLSLLEYDAVIPSTNELIAGQNFFAKCNQIKNNLVSTNAGWVKIENNKQDPFLIGTNINQEQQPFALPYIIKDLSGFKAAILSLNTDSYIKGYPSIKRVIEFKNPDVAIKETLPKIKDKGVELIIVFSDYEISVNKELIKNNPEVDIIINPNSYDPKAVPAMITKNDDNIAFEETGFGINVIQFKISDDLISNVKQTLKKIKIAEVKDPPSEYLPDLSQEVLSLDHISYLNIKYNELNLETFNVDDKNLGLGNEKVIYYHLTTNEGDYYVYHLIHNSAKGMNKMDFIVALDSSNKIKNLININPILLSNDHTVIEGRIKTGIIGNDEKCLDKSEIQSVDAISGATITYKSLLNNLKIIYTINKDYVLKRSI